MTLELFIALSVGMVTIIGGIIVRDRQVMKAIQDGDEKLHKRINTVEHSYVRKEDLNGHLRSIETLVTGVRDEQRATNTRIDNLLTILAGGKKP